MVARHATQWHPVTDDVVLWRAVIDHAARCVTCRAGAGSCPYDSRLRELAQAAQTIVRKARKKPEKNEVMVRVGPDAGQPTGPHCRAAVLSLRPGLHMECARPQGKCACYCHKDGPPTK